ncbi:MAG TPA: NTP transferase domain-containing protein [Vicinamibacterales bacterium]|nr:NTP transferase domain-containing protein [Vicinamibacterales bacterium]
MRATTAVTRAIILAAGNGDRFKTDTGQSKLVRQVLGIPLIIRTMNSAARAGIRHAEVVLGYKADNVRALVLQDKPSDLSVRFHLNERWREENGLSVLAARGAVDGERFALLMGDHLFDSELLRRLLSTPGADGESMLGIDPRRAPREVSEEATRVRLDGDGRIVQIGKLLDPYDALDTGLFVCTASLFDALDESCSAGDTTLSGGVRRLASRGLVRGIDIGDGVWWDIDTVEDLEIAEDLLLSQPA